jgi:hypothetical protein
VTVVDTDVPAPHRVEPSIRRGPLRRRWPAVLLFVLLSVGYFAIGWVLIMRYNLFEWDAISRVANAGYTLWSRDPHLAAVGFVWNPLPSLVDLPLLPLSRWWPELRTHGLAGVFQSAFFMAGSAMMVRQIAFDRGVGTFWRWVAVFCYALNPVIVIYGASAMSEAALAFCLLWCVRYLLRWVDSQRVLDLAWAGTALGVGYLTRYEVIPAAAATAALVGVIAFLRSPRAMRIPSAVLSVTIASFPTAVAFVVWAVTGWIVSGELFATLSSQYGNTSQVQFASAHGGFAYNSDWMVIVQRLFGMQPFVGIAVIAAIALWALTKKFDPLVPVVVFGSVLVFAVWGQYSGTTFGWFRFYILAIPLVIVVALVCWAPTEPPFGLWRLDTLSSKLGAVLLSASVVIAMPVTGWSMLTENTSGAQLLLGVNSLVHPEQYPLDQQWYRRAGDDDRRVAAYLDSKNLPDGVVLTDTFVSAVVWLASDNPRQFVVTSDYDFTAKLNRPWDSGIRYILVSNPTGNAAEDAITQRYPRMWADGAGLGTLVFSAQGPNGQERWRLYKLHEPPDEEGSGQPPR